MPEYTVPLTLCTQTSVFYRVTPKHKVVIVKVSMIYYLQLTL